MAFTIEDGTGLEAANAYLALAAFREHHDDRGTDTSAHLDSDVQAAIVQATDYVDKRFGRRYRGDRASYSQGLEWPRTNAYTDEDYAFEGVPRPLEKAVAEYALIVLQLGRNLAPLPEPPFSIVDPETGEVTAGGGQISEKAEEVGPIKDSTKWNTGSSNSPMVGSGNLIQQIPAYPQADLWIEEIIDSYMSREVFRG